VKAPPAFSKERDSAVSIPPPRTPSSAAAPTADLVDMMGVSGAGNLDLGVRTSMSDGDTAGVQGQFLGGDPMYK